MKKKVLISVSSITPGSGLSNYVLNLIKILLGVNYQIIVLTTHDHETNYERININNCGKVTFVSFGGYKKIFKYLKILHFIRKTKPDIIINNYNAVIQFLLPFIHRKTKVIHVLHSTTDDFYRIANINGKFVSGWIVPTSAMKIDFNTYTNFKYENRIKVIPHGVQKPLSETSITKSLIKELVFVGVLYEHKGVLILPEIIRKLQIQKGIFHFTIIGGGIEQEYLIKELKQEISNGIVKMTGVISSEEVYHHLSKADIFVYPTHIDSFGLVIAEAMINATVPIVTHLKGITDNLIDEGENGYLIEQDNVDSFVEHICRLLQDEELLRSMKIAAKEKAEKCFSLEVMQRNYQHYLQNL